MDKNNKVTNPHDKFFKLTFSRKDVILSFLEARLPQEILDQIDQDSLRLTNREFVSATGKSSYSDCMFKTLIKGTAHYLYLHVEHVRHEVTQRESAPSALGPHQSPIVTSLVRFG